MGTPEHGFQIDHPALEGGFVPVAASGGFIGGLGGSAVVGEGAAVFDPSALVAAMLSRQP